MGKIIELSDQHYAIMAAAAAERGESVDSMMTRWLRDLASGSDNPNGAEAPDAIPPVAIKASSASGTAWQRARGPLAMALYRADMLRLHRQRSLGLGQPAVAQYRQFRERGGPTAQGPRGCELHERSRWSRWSWRWMCKDG